MSKRDLLWVAVEKGDVTTVRKLLEEVDQQELSKTVLVLACKEGQIEVVKILLTHPGIDVNAKDKVGFTALLEACKYEHIEVVKILLTHPDIDVSGQWNVLSFVCMSGHIEIVQMLLAHPDIDLNEQYEDGFSALFVASRYGHAAVVTMLLAHPDINVNLPDRFGGTALMRTCCFGHIEVVKALLSHPGIDVNVKDERGYTALFEACVYGHSEVVKILLTHPDIDVNIQSEYNGTALLMACSEGHVEVVKMLLACPGIDVNIHNNGDGSTALFAATNYEHIEIVEILLAHPTTDVNMPRRDGTTALVKASEKGRIEVVKILLTHQNIDMNVKDMNEYTALMMACSEGHIEVVKILLAHPGIDVNAKDKYGQTALAKASIINNFEMVTILLAHPEIDVNAKDILGSTALAFVCNDEYIEVLKVLLAHPAIDVNVQNLFGCTALALVCKEGHIEVLKVLLAHPGIDVNMQDNDGYTPLMVASLQNDEEIVRVLKAYPGTKRNLKEKNGQTALDLASSLEVKALLKSQSGGIVSTMKRWIGVKNRSSNTRASETNIRAVDKSTTQTSSSIDSSPTNTKPSSPLPTVPSPLPSVSPKVPLASNRTTNEEIKNDKQSADRPVIDDMATSLSVVARTEVLEEEDPITTTRLDLAALDAFLKSDTSDLLWSAGRVNEIHLKLNAHERALHLLVNKKKECPSLFWFYPKKRELRNWLRDPLKCLLQDSLMMVVVCPVTLRVVKCGPDGLGWEISTPKAWVKKWGPAILFSIYVMQAAMIAGRAMGIPLPQLPSAGDVASTLGLKCDALTAGMNEIVNQELLMESLSVFTSTTEGLLDEQDAPMQSLCAKMHIQDQQLREQRKAVKKGAPFPPVRAEVTLETDMPTQMFEESYKSIHSFLTTGENAKLGKLEDQLRGSMERVLADDGDVEWVSVEAVEVWKQQHQLVKRDALESELNGAKDFHTVPPIPSPVPVLGSDHVPAVCDSPVTPVSTIASSWLAVRLRQKGVREELIVECEQKLVVDEDHSEEHLMAALSSEQFNSAYLKEVGIKALGLQQKLLAIHQELMAQYDSPENTSPSSAKDTKDMVTEELEALKKEIVALKALPSAETQAAMDKRLEALTSQLNKLEASSSSAKSGDSPVPGTGNSSGGGGAKGGLQQVLKQRTDTATASINPRTGQQYTVDELVLEIQLIRGDVGALATDVSVIKEFI